MRLLGLGIPFAYALAFIVLPIYRLKLTYAESMIVLFWVPSAILYLYHHHWIREKNIRGRVVWTMAVCGVTSFLFEYIALGMRIWGFGDKAKYLGIKIWSSPLEEFMYYWGAIPFSLFLYFYYYRIFEDRSRPKPLPIISAWFAIGIPFTWMAFKMYKLIEHRRALSWPSLLMTVGVFYLTMIFVEHYAVVHQFWVYNYSVLWGPKIWEIPIEEYLMYYWMGTAFVVVLYHFLSFRPRIVLRDPDSKVKAEASMEASSSRAEG